MTSSTHKRFYDISWAKISNVFQRVALNVWFDGAERRIFFRHFSNLGGELQSRCLLIGPASYCQYFRDPDTG